MNHINKPSSYAWSSARKLSSTALLLLALFAAGCNSEEENNPALHDKNGLTNTVPATPAEVHHSKSLSIGDIGTAVYDNDALKELKTPGYTQAHVWPYTLFSKDGKSHISVIRANLAGYPDKELSLSAMIWDDVKAVSANRLVAHQNDHYELIKLEGEDKISADMEWAVKSYSSIGDAEVSDIRDIENFTGADYHGVVLFMKNGTKLYINGDTTFPIENISFKQLYKAQEQQGVSKIISTKTGNLLEEGSTYIPFDNVGYSSEGKLVLLKNGNIMNYYAHYIPLIKKEAAANNLFMSVPNPAHKDLSSTDNSLAGVEARKKNDEIPYTLDKNVSAQFKNFTVRYIGVDNGGEGESYYISQDAKKFYSIDVHEDGKVFIADASQYSIDEIISNIPVSSDLMMRRLFTGNYTESEGQSAKYIGEKGGLQMVQYRVQGIDGSLEIQTGAKVKEVLTEDQSAPEGYEIQGFYVNGKALTDDAKCPKGTIIIIKYKKAAATN